MIRRACGRRLLAGLASRGITGTLAAATAAAIAVAPAVAAPSLQEVYRRASPAVALITQVDAAGKVTSLASGFVVAPDGVLVTNYHVIEPDQGAVHLRVKLPDGQVFTSVGVVYADKRRDVAVLTVNATGLPALTLGDSDRVEVGERVVAIGNPEGLALTLTEGIVENLRPVPGAAYRFIQHQAPLSAGSSGGPLLNADGEVIGINAFRIEGAQNVNGAIPINSVKPYLGDSATRTWEEWARREAASPPAPPVPSGSSQPPGVPGPHTFFGDAAGYRGQSDGFQLGFVAGVFDAASLFAKAARAGGISAVATVDLFQCLDGKGDRLGDLRSWISGVASGAPGDDPLVSTIARACQRVFSADTFFERVSDYRDHTDDFKLGFSAGLYDAISQFAAEAQAGNGLDADTALGIFRCLNEPGDKLVQLRDWVTNVTQNTPDKAPVIGTLVKACRP